MAKRSGNAALAQLRKDLQALPKSLAHDVAQRAAPDLTTATVEAFQSNRTVYGDPRPAGVNGNALRLDRTGQTRRTLKFVANGTTVRCVLGTDYAKYLIGRYGILPNGPIPVAWDRRLQQILADTKAGPK